MAELGTLSAKITAIGPCDFQDAGTGQRCWRTAPMLSLRDPLGHRMRRFLCADHSDWIEASEQPPVSNSEQK